MVLIDGKAFMMADRMFYRRLGMHDENEDPNYSNSQQYRSRRLRLNAYQSPFNREPTSNAYMCPSSVEPNANDTKSSTEASSSKKLNETVKTTDKVHDKDIIKSTEAAGSNIIRSCTSKACTKEVTKSTEAAISNTLNKTVEKTSSFISINSTEAAKSSQKSYCQKILEEIQATYSLNINEAKSVNTTSSQSSSSSSSGTTARKSVRSKKPVVSRKSLGPKKSVEPIKQTNKHNGISVEKILKNIDMIKYELVFKKTNLDKFKQMKEIDLIALGITRKVEIETFLKAIGEANKFH